MKKQPRRSKKSGLVSFVVLVLLCLALVLVWSQRVAIEDWARLRNYQPSAAVAKLAVATSMNDTGKHLFYVYHPGLFDKANFAGKCSQDEKSIVLGCYASHQGIYLYDVTDPRLNGVEEVTAAHEMLHVAYERLSPADRQEVDSMTAQAYANLHDERITKTINQYRKRDASVVPNELHSILATEVRELPPNLESYYARYFNDRKAVIVYSEKYEAEFTSRQEKVSGYDSKLTNLKSEIEGMEVRLKSQLQSLNTERARMDALSRDKQYEEYNAAVPGFNQAVRDYNAKVSRVQKLIDEYNKTVKARNALATEENELYKAIDSRPATVNNQ